jgi:Uma2 family endonuclease
MTAAEYLAWEREQLDKHEFHRGEVFAMAGGSVRHNALAAEMVGELRNALRGSGCRPLGSDQRLALRGGDRYVYADVVVVCGQVELAEGTTDVVSNPTVVCEVLSKSTERYDRGEKWERYQELASLTDYLLVSQRAPLVEHYQRNADGSWRYTAVRAGDQVTLAGGARVSVDALFEGAFELPGDEAVSPADAG